MFKAISEKALTYHPDCIMTNSDVNIYDTRGSDNLPAWDVYSLDVDA